MATIILYDMGQRGQRRVGDTGDLAKEFWDWAGDGRYALGQNPYHFLPRLDIAVSFFLDFHLRATMGPRDTIALQRAILASGPPP